MLKLMSPTTRQYLLIALLLSLISCTNEPLALPAETPSQKVVSPTPIITLTPIPATEFSTPLPTQPTIAFITPDAIQIERWREYEDELAKLVLSNSGAEYPRYEDALCEWDVLGRDGQDIYVWAECTAGSGVGRGPAVVYLEQDGSIRDVKYAFPSPSRDVTISRLFPEDIQAKIYTYFSSEWSRELQRHLAYRLTHPEVPPLIILSGMPTSSTTPLPPQPTIAFITPDAIQVERWREYEVALAQGILPMFPFESILCEWDILGRSGQEVYVWALCAFPNKGDDMRPVVIHLEADGSIRDVEIPKRGSSSDISRMFPEEVQAKFSLYTGNSLFDGRLKEMLNHLIYRETHPEEPPLVVLLATWTPSPTP